MTIFKKSAIFVVLAIILAIPPGVLAKDMPFNPYLVIDAGDGSIIAANHELDLWYPASLTKLMTAYVTMMAIKDGEVEIGSPVRISKRAANMPHSRMNYKIGTLLRTDAALKILIVKSANDIAVALAQSVSGSEDKFVERMNNTASLLGLSATRFTNANGLHSRNQHSSARDLAILTRRILLDFPQYSKWFAIPAIRVGDNTHYSYNLLLERYVGANGMKTGFVCASGYNMVASAKRANRQLIAVVLGEKSQTDRAVLAARLLSEAFAKPELLIGNILAFGSNSDTKNSAAKPKNMRSVLCTAEARKTRYEPGAGKAKIVSEYLSERKITDKPTIIKTGGIDGKPSKAYAAIVTTSARPVPVPTRRPSYIPSDEAQTPVQNKPVIIHAIPVPTPRPEI